MKSNKNYKVRAINKVRASNERHTDEKESKYQNSKE